MAISRPGLVRKAVNCGFGRVSRNAVNCGFGRVSRNAINCGFGRVSKKSLPQKFSFSVHENEGRGFEISFFVLVTRHRIQRGGFCLVSIFVAALVATLIAVDQLNPTLSSLSNRVLLEVLCAEYVLYSHFDVVFV